MGIKERKVLIIGAGHVGSHVGYALASEGIVETIVYIDIDKEKAKAQALDIYDASVYFSSHVNVYAGDYSDADDSDFIVIAAGPLPDINKGQADRMDTLAQTVSVMKDIISNLKKTNFDGIVLNISNPADVITHYIQNALCYPSKKILSTSTTLDSARLRRSIASRIGIDQKSVYAYVLGEHGESQMVAWSTVTIAGKPLLELMKDNPSKYGALNLDEIAREARRGGWDILQGKGSTEFGIGSSLAEVARAVFSNEKRILPVSVMLCGEYGKNDVYASVPAVIGKDGVEEIIELRMTDDEKKLFDNSCEVMQRNYEKALAF